MADRRHFVACPGDRGRGDGAGPRALGRVLMLAAAAGLYHAFGVNPATIFPIAICALGGVLAIAAGRLDAERAHF